MLPFVAAVKLLVVLAIVEPLMLDDIDELAVGDCSENDALKPLAAASCNT